MTSALAKAGEMVRTFHAQVRDVLTRGAVRSADGVLVLAPRAQTTIVIAASVIALTLLVLIFLIHALFSGSAEAARETPASDNALRLTPAQMEYLKIEPVNAIPFRSQQTTEGQIALDDDHSTPVFSPYSGRVLHLYAAPGDQVKPGAPLMSVQAGEIVQAQDDLAGALNSVATAHAQLKLADTALRRQRDLYEAKAAALKDLEAAEVEDVDARGKSRTAETELAAVRNRLRILGQSDAQIATLERNPVTAHINPEATIAAPIAGTVMLRQIGTGQYIQANAPTPVYVIGDLSKVWLIANVRESEVAAVKIGDQVEVTVPAFPNRTFRARITYIAASIDPNTHRLPVRAEVENPDGALKPQMFASFRIVTGAENVAVAVPESAIIYDADKAHVWVVANDGTLNKRPIQVGRRQGTLFEVTDGLARGERIVTSGPLFIDRAAVGG